MKLPLEQRISPNQDARFEGSEVRFLILHYTACDFETALRYLTHPQSDSPVSAHYLIDEDGRTVQLVSESRRAWHAGVSRWGAYENLNTWSIGIELVNLGHEVDYTPFPEAQMRSLSHLSQGLLARHPIPPSHVLGHADIALTRKKDPGELLEWQRLAREGVGLQLTETPVPVPFHPEGARRLLHEIGYDVAPVGPMDQRVCAALEAFCMRCFPDFLKDPQTDHVMGALQAYRALL